MAMLAKKGELSENDFAGLKWAKNLFAFLTIVFKKSLLSSS